MSDETIVAIGPAARRIGPGTRLNDLYEIDALVATGGMGEVYRGHAIETGDEVAIKTIKPEFAGSGSALALFRKEASALHNLYHEAIIRYYVFSIDKPLGLPYLAMEFVSGEALSEIAARGAMPAEAIDTLRRRLASGLHAAHALGIIHRDVSPDNVILPGGDPARAKIIDFGIARSSLGGATVIGDGFAGKYGYVSPEQLGLYGADVTPRSDIYSLGLVLAEAALGRRLDMGHNPVDVVEKRRRVPDLTGIDARLRPLIESMLQPDPKDRIGSMAEVAASVEPTVTGRQTKHPSKRKAEKTAATAPIRRPDSPGSPSRGRVPIVAGGGIAVLALLAGGVYYALQGSGSSGSDIASVNTNSRLEEPASADRQANAGQATAAQASAMPANPPSAAILSGASGAVLSSPAVPQTAVSPTAVPPPFFSSPTPPMVEPQAQPRATSASPTLDPPVQRTAPNTQTASIPPGALGTSSAPPQGSSRPPPEPEKPSANAPPPQRDAVAAPPVAPPLAPIERVANYIRDYRGGDCFYLSPISVGAREAAIEAFGSATPSFAAFDDAFSAALRFEAQIQLRLVTPAQCGVVDVLAQQALQRRMKVPKLALNRDRMKSGEELTGTLDLADDGNAEILLVDDDGDVHNLARNVKRTGRHLTFALRLQAPAGTAKPQLVVGVASPEPLTFLKSGPGTKADALFRAIGDEVARPGSTVAVAARYLRLGE